jgi:formylglycine-generating enzyme required for sulfatase activity
MKSTVLLFCFAAAVGLFAAAESKSDEQGKEATPPKRVASDKFIGKEAGQVRDDNGLKMKLVWCPPGFVTMETVERISVPAAEHDEKDDKPNNDDDEVDTKDKPVPELRQTEKITPVKVFLSQGYWLGKYEVTQSEWKQVMKTEPWKGQDTTREGAEFPATFVDWNDACDFCRKLTQQEREAGRMTNDWEYTLPTEAQWERACRARTETRFSFGNDDTQTGEYAWFIENTVKAGEDFPHPVGQKRPNLWGLHDMHGNVWEWCRDSYSDKLPGGRDPEVTEKGANRVLRGGGIYRSASDCRSAYRNMHTPDWRLFDLGIRVALSPSGTK